MEIVNRVARMASLTTKALAGDVNIGLIPTMGAIHPGHIGLIQTARRMSDIVVVSIFVDRLQFLSDEEYRNYPRDITKDVDQLREVEADYVFTPSEEEMYREGFSTYVAVENFGMNLPGLPRDAYFRGMPTSVLKLISIVKPRFMFFGQKDGLQGCILRKMVRDLNLNTEVVVTPVPREASGLAFAARNYFLSGSEKAAASVIHRSLEAAGSLVSEGELQSKKILKQIKSVIDAEPLASLEYAIVAGFDTLEPLNRIEASAIIGVGARIGTTILNDSLFVQAPGR